MKGKLQKFGTLMTYVGEISVLDCKSFIIFAGIIIGMLFIGLVKPWAEKPDNADITSRVSVETNKQEYQRDEEIVVTVTNKLDKKITTFDQQAFCTIIKLEQQDGTEWRKMKICFSGAPRSLVSLSPHTETIVKLLALSPGIYRASIIFSLGVTFNFGKSFVASSLPFSVQRSRVLEK